LNSMLIFLMRANAPSILYPLFDHPNIL
jgi:hypothetical protein